MNPVWVTIIIILYLSALAYLGVKGYSQTSNSSDYLVAGRKIHPLILALSYGAAFISTAAIVGFGGMAAKVGLSMFWLVFLNIFVGIFIAFAVYGRRMRQIGYILQAHTFPEVMGRRFNSKFIQIFGGIFIFILMPIYTAAVLIGGARILQETFMVDYNFSLMIFSLIVTFYVLLGGIKGVMYADAMQGGIMFMGSIFLIFFTVRMAGGIRTAFETLNTVKDRIPPELVEAGHQGWTAMPQGGSPLWWLIVTSLTIGVGIGVLAQPQLAVRFMMVKSKRELYRSLVAGSLFILIMVGGSYFVGTLSNLYFLQEYDMLAVEYESNIDRIIPLYIREALPPWFMYLFMLSILSAAISTLSSQFHTVGTAVGRDVFQKGLGLSRGAILLTRTGIVIALIVTVILSYYLPAGVIAQATAMFFGFCTATFLPSYTAAIFWRKTTRKSVIASSLTGFFVTLFLFLLAHESTASVFGVSDLLIGSETILSEPFNLMDPLVIALPLSTLILIVTALLTEDEVPHITRRLFAKNDQ